MQQGFILLGLVLLCVSLKQTNAGLMVPIWSDETVEESAETSSQESEEDENDEHPFFHSLKQLMRFGDDKYGIPAVAPYIDEEVYVTDSGAPVALMVTGLDTFHGWIQNTNDNNIIELGLLFPRLVYIFQHKTDTGAIEMEVHHNNMTLKALIKMRMHTKCAFLEEMKVEIDFDTTDYMIQKTGTIDPEAETFILGILEGFGDDNKEELMEMFETDIEEEAAKLFEKLECWYMSDAKLLNSYKNNVN